MAHGLAHGLAHRLAHRLARVTPAAGLPLAAMPCTQDGAPTTGAYHEGETMRIALRVILAAGIAGAYAFANGYLSLRADFLQAGLELGWRNDPQIVGAQFPLLYSSLIAVLSALCAFYIVWRLLRGGRSGYAEAAAFVAVLLAVVVWGIVTYKNPVELMRTLDFTATLQWRYGVLSPALHTVMVLPVVVAIGQAVRTAFDKRTGGSVGRDDAPVANPYAPPPG